MKNHKNISLGIVTALVITFLVGGALQMQSLNHKAASHEAMLQKIIAELTTPSTLPAIPAFTTTSVVTTTSTPQHGGPFDEKVKAACRKQRDTGASRLAAQGAPAGYVFYGDCSQDYGMWFWAYPGSDSDYWHEDVPSGLTRDPNNFWTVVPQRGGGPGVPTAAQHPYYPDALTFDKLQLGMDVCLKEGDKSYTSWHVLGKGFYVTPTSAAVMPMILTGKGTGAPAYMSAEDFGTVPYQNIRMWSSARLVKGACS